MVRGHDGNKRKGHDQTNEHRPDQPQETTPKQPGAYAGEKTYNSQRSLHDRCLLVAWRPNRCSGFRVAAHSRGVLDETDVNRSSGEKNATQNRKKLKDDKHT